MAAPVLDAAFTNLGNRHGDWMVSTAADADTGALTITHGLPVQVNSGSKPINVDLSITPATAAGQLAGYIASVTATTIVVTKTLTGTGSGGADQLRVSLTCKHTVEQ